MIADGARPRVKKEDISKMKKSLVKLIVGLGNHSIPSTRHSIGMSTMNKLADHLGINWVYEKKCTGFIAKYLTDKFELVLLKPRVPMNINGKSILRTVNHHDVSTENIVLVQDDLDKPLGKIRVKLDGSASGHNGVRSAISSLKTDKIKRYKIGIGRPTDRSKVTEYVLEDFHARELLVVEKTLEKCVELLLDELDIGREDIVAMSRKDDEKESVNQLKRTSGMNHNDSETSVS